MDTPKARPSGVAALSSLTPPRPGDERAYVEPYGLAASDVAALVELAKRWIHEARQNPTDPSPSTWAPVHALRALAELGAEIVVPTFLGMLDELDASDEIQYLEELPPVCATIGGPAVAYLTAYLHDTSHEEYPRIAAAHGLCLVGATDPASRARVVEVLADALRPMSDAQPDVNANVVGYLADLEAVEHAELIERAFAEGVVNAMVCGDWPRIAFELGIGPAPVRRPSVLEEIAAQIRAPRRSEASARRHAGRGKIEKGARKRQKQARKRNRRR